MPPIIKLETQQYPRLVQELPKQPDNLWSQGTIEIGDNKVLAVVGSRKCTAEGRQVCQTLISSLRGLPITIVSGLAYGIDSVAHQASLDNSLHTVAIPGSGLDKRVLYPAKHRALADQILASGGGLLSPFEPSMSAAKWTFPTRNTLMAGMADAILVIQATEKSGTIITAHQGAELGREVLVCPGSVLDESFAGNHYLIRNGATLTSSVEHILEALDLDRPEQLPLRPSISLSPDEQKIFSLLDRPLRRPDLVRLSTLSPPKTMQIISKLELLGLITTQGGVIYIK